MSRRLNHLTGLVGIVLVVAGLATDAAPTSSWSDARIESWYDTHSLGQWVLSAYLIAAAAPFLLAFTAGLRDRLAEAGASARSLSFTSGAGIAFAVTLLTGAGLYAAVPAAMVFADAPAPSADTSRYLLGAAYGILVMFSAFAAALLAGTVSVVSLRRGAVPRWLAVAGLPASVLMLANAVLPMAVITLWFVTASITLTARPAPARHDLVPGRARADVPA